MKKTKWTDAQFEAALRKHRIKAAKIQLKASREILIITEKMAKELQERS